MTETLLRLARAETGSRPIGIARIGVGIAILLDLAASGDVLIRLGAGGGIPTPWSELTAGALSARVAWGLAAGWLVTAGAFTLGARTRLAGTALVAVLAAVVAADRQLYSNHLYLMILVVALLTMADAGASVSLDARRAGGRERVPAWPVFLLRAQVSIVYLFAGLAKLTPAYLSGSVVAGSLRDTGPLAVPDAWRFFEPMFAFSLLGIATELFVAVGLWSRRLRPAALAAGVGLHLFIAVWLAPTFELVIFGLLMLSLYATFRDDLRSARVPDAETALPLAAPGRVSGRR